MARHFVDELVDPEIECPLPTSTSTNGGGKKNNGPALLTVVPIVVTLGTILVGALALN